MTPVQLWRADAVMLAVWRLANDRQSWKAVTKGSQTRYTYIHVPPLPAMGVSGSRLILWQGDYADWVRQLDVLMKDELKAHLCEPAPMPVALYDHKGATVAPSSVRRERIGLALHLETIALDATRNVQAGDEITQGVPRPLEQLAELAQTLVPDCQRRGEVLMRVVMLCLMIWGSGGAPPWPRRRRRAWSRPSPVASRCNAACR